MVKGNLQMFLKEQPDERDLWCCCRHIQGARPENERISGMVSKFVGVAIHAPMLDPLQIIDFLFERKYGKLEAVLVILPTDFMECSSN